MSNLTDVQDKRQKLMNLMKRMTEKGVSFHYPRGMPKTSSEKAVAVDILNRQTKPALGAKKILSLMRGL